MALWRHIVAVRTRTPITAAEILKALSASNGDVRAAADAIGVSERTLYRRMAEFGIKPRVEYRVEAQVA